TSAANPITAKNTGNAALTFQASIGGSNATDFSEADTCQGSIAAGASCNLMVTFAPKAAGSRNALLFVTATNIAPSNNQQTVPLGGTAVDFSLGAAAGSSTSVSVAAGQAATFNLQLNPIDGFSGTVAITCAGAPVSSTCSSTPSSINATGNSAIPFAVNIATSASRLGIPADRPAAPVIPKNWVIVIFLTLLLCLRLVSAKRRRFNLIAFAPAAAFLWCYL
ncbi:MAG: choice-of-anchor D domain-containing protein, partial [Candidatus Acidiferrales bacterium]